MKGCFTIMEKNSHSFIVVPLVTGEPLPFQPTGNHVDRTTLKSQGGAEDISKRMTLLIAIKLSLQLQYFGE